jgi:hypothetical protein
MRDNSRETTMTTFARMAAATLLAILVASTGCGDNKKTAQTDGPAQTDAAVTQTDGPPATSDAGPQYDGPFKTDAGCYVNPVSHVEIINACTNAQAIDKHPTLPLLLDGGVLPPLQ